LTVQTRGKAELEALATKSAAAFSSREQRVMSLTEGHDRIVAEIDYHSVVNADLSPELKTGSRLDLRGVSVFELSGEKISRLTLWLIHVDAAQKQYKPCPMKSLLLLLTMLALCLCVTGCDD